MNIPTIPEQFHNALQESPFDHTLLLAIADWFEENDEPLAGSLLRWHVAKGFTPYSSTTSPIKNAGYCIIKNTYSHIPAFIHEEITTGMFADDIPCIPHYYNRLLEGWYRTHFTSRLLLLRLLKEVNFAPEITDV